MLDLFSRIQRIARHFRTVVITGETGTGKDLIAKALHTLSPVSDGTLVALNCSAVVETLFESELFGHVRGAFTGATQDKVGLFEHAHRRSPVPGRDWRHAAVYASEVASNAPEPGGSASGITNTAQSQRSVIAATHQDLRQKILDKQFREDLDYRLAMIEMRVPALRERMEDLPHLTRDFIAKYSEQFNKPINRSRNAPRSYSGVIRGQVTFANLKT